MMNFMGPSSGLCRSGGISNNGNTLASASTTNCIRMRSASPRNSSFRHSSKGHEQAGGADVRLCQGAAVAQWSSASDHCWHVMSLRAQYH
ncbi:hypothetical protein TNCV_1799431 [Trichonephila clavipes]|nr:hypothetical protein TNCV_1799431 [Trichonephila clavipes]